MGCFIVVIWSGNLLLIMLSQSSNHATALHLSFANTQMGYLQWHSFGLILNVDFSASAERWFPHCPWPTGRGLRKPDLLSACWEEARCVKLWKIALIMLGICTTQKRDALPALRSCPVSAGLLFTFCKSTSLHLSPYSQMHLQRSGQCPLHVWPQVTSLWCCLAAARWWL